MTEKLTLRRRLSIAGLAFLGGVSLVACEDEPVDYAGIGHEFTVTGVVSDSESDGLIQLHEDGLEVLQANGKAEKFLGKKKNGTFFSNELNFVQKYNQEADGFWSGCGDDVYVGNVYDIENHQIEPEDLDQGDIVRIEGKIRESRYWQSTGKSGYCNEKDLAVYDSIRILQEYVELGN